MMLSFHEYWEYAVLFLMAAIPWIEIVVVIPLGIAGGLSPVAVSILAFTGNLLTILLLIALYKKWTEWRERRREEKGITKKTSKRKERAKKIWERYGLPGLALIGPFFVGTHLTAVMGLALGSRKNLVTAWMTFSLLVWTIGLTAASFYGLDFLNLIRKDGFF